MTRLDLPLPDGPTIAASTLLTDLVSRDGANYNTLFSGPGAPSPAVGVWLGVGGLAGVFLACLLGPKG